MLKESDFPLSIQIKILGRIVQINAIYKSLIQDILDFFSINENEPKFWGTPDVQLFINSKHMSRYMFRSRMKNQFLEHVYFCDGLDTKNLKKWEFLTPPLPPFESSGFKNQLIAIHAGAISDQNKAILFVGDRGSGKTTLTISLANKLHYEYLTDETVVIQRHTDYVYSFPRLVLTRTSANIESVKNKYRADKLVPKINKTGAQVSQIYFLNPTSSQPVGIFKITSLEAILKLFESYRYIGTSIENSSSTLINLSEKECFRVSYTAGDFTSLKNAESLIYKNLIREQQ
ncbi:hypothetical protein [Lactobacillus panisapium]|uniref:hypothetical protein n=1 Tax=Lactobacillus panisapium TaxID=2012495 RepID=UPI0022E35A76|nr:hypothetical protein [Lactobacillus panisapium]